MKDKDSFSVNIAGRWKEDILSMNILDAGSWLGKSSDFPLMEEGTPELISGIHSAMGIREALISHWADGRYSPDESNSILLESLSGRENWHGIITALPFTAGNSGNGLNRKLFGSKKVAGARIYPATFRHSPSCWCIGPLCEILSERKMPLFIFHTEASFDDLHNIAVNFPALKIIVETQPKKIIYHSRSLLPLMKKCLNILADISNLTAPGLLELFVENIGCGRLIFSSFLPANDPLVPAGILIGSRIGKKEKVSIAGDNMRRILEEIKK